mgnify:CR=1 FL=1
MEDYVISSSYASYILRTFTEYPYTKFWTVLSFDNDIMPNYTCYSCLIIDYSKMVLGLKSDLYQFHPDR